MSYEIENGVLKKYTEEPGVTRFTVPDNVREIGAGAFTRCRDLTEVIIPQSVIRIGESAFKSCYDLKRIILPEGLTEIEQSTFAWCESLEEVVLPEYLRHIGWSAFIGCESLKAIQLPKRLQVLGDSAFEGCVSLEKLVIPMGLTKIGNAACCAAAEIKVSRRNPYYTSADGVLYDKAMTRLLQCPTGRQQLIVPGSVQVIGKRAFVDCKELVSVTLPAHLKKIETWAFQHCKKLPAIILPPEVSEITGNAFMDCEALGDIRVAPGNPYFTAENGVLYNKQCTEIVHFPLGQKAVTLPDTVTHFQTRLSAGQCESVTYKGFTFRCPRGFMRFLLEAVINKAFPYFASDLPAPVQYDTLCKLWRMEPDRREEISGRMQESLKPIFRWLIDEDNLDTAEKLLSMGDFDFGETLEELILYANQKARFDFELLLLNYKNAGGGYSNGGEFQL